MEALSGREIIRQGLVFVYDYIARLCCIEPVE